MYNYNTLPTALQGGMKRYIEDGISAGHFLTAVLENDLFSAVMRADADNLKELPNIVKWIYWEIPAEACGSETIVKAWLKKERKVA